MTAETGRWLSPADIDTTINCRTPGCMQEATATSGRGVYCRECRIRRGTMAADGKPLRGDTAGVPKVTTGKSTNGADPSPEPDGDRITRGDSFAITAAKANGQPTADETEAPAAVAGGPFERASLELVDAGQELDAALAAYTELKPRIAAALQSWREALQSLPDTTNGHAPDIGS